MYIIDIEKLEIGDIILTKSESRISQMVRRLTGSQYSHAMLYVGISSIIDSDGYGVQSNNVQRILFEKEENAVALRLKEISDPSVFRNVEYFSRQKIGTQYSTEEARISAIAKDLSAKEPNRQFCTRFVAQAYSSAGIELVKNSDYCTPEELLKSEKLKIINNALRKASIAEIEFASTDNPSIKQREIHNAILQKARELSGKDIQTFEDLSKVIIELPEIDFELTQFITSTGYLSLMEEDEEKNPWHYNAERMVEYYKEPEIIFDTALYFASTESKTRERLNLTISSLIQFDRSFPRAYFKMEIELYKKLIDYSYKRESEAIKVLKHF